MVCPSALTSGGWLRRPCPCLTNPSYRSFDDTALLASRCGMTACFSRPTCVCFGESFPMVVFGRCFVVCVHVNKQLVPDRAQDNADRVGERVAGAEPPPRPFPHDGNRGFLARTPYKGNVSQPTTTGLLPCISWSNCQASRTRFQLCQHVASEEAGINTKLESVPPRWMNR